MAVQDDLKALLKPAIEAMGFEFVGVEYLSNPKNRLVRIFIDRAPDGVSIDDCADVSREVSALLDVEDPVSGQYSLEVSSPGVERPLFEPGQYAAFAGEEAVLQLHAPIDGRRKLTGILRGADDARVEIEIDGAIVDVPFDAIRRANLKPDWDALMAGEARTGDVAE
ncbi:ribosome maturation factor RimP [Wenzhouxiangella sp. XN79A]|uniref:ribosome maturation factor RimP n=1 Tax=Wenzhouxiangella sp. XN79A TaxID=2724193 RepID=UPI00144AC2CA|nr:ribosome maturation factor RimP [Wenzhouxiangella sp. XN79A]NKI33798.1 ribosome maturation factor RimP [Wenzhouxiangella sp. XN79A]